MQKLPVNVIHVSHTWLKLNIKPATFLIVILFALTLKAASMVTSPCVVELDAFIITLLIL